jgi:hypothetical protein
LSLPIDGFVSLPRRRRMETVRADQQSPASVTPPVGTLAATLAVYVEGSDHECKTDTPE